MAAEKDETHDDIIALQPDQSRTHDDVGPLRPDEAAALFAVGEEVAGIYEIRGILGEGGMGRVYEAYDRILNRPVAIKVPRPGHGHDLLHREAQAMAALRGRGLPSVHFMGSYRGIPYCVMERLYGVTLAEYLDQRGRDRRFEVDEALGILLGITDALVGVHRAGLIHRDLKPSNIMLSPGNRVLILDFGVFRTEGQDSDESIIYGSPDYVAPEEISGMTRAGQAHFTDIYALGVIAFEVLAGRRPFLGKSVQEVLFQHVSERPPRLSELRDDLPDDLDDLIDQLLAKEPEQRPLSVEAVGARLLAIQRQLGEPLTTAPPSASPAHVLIVDDDANLRKLLRVTLEMALPGAQIFTAASAEQALALIRDRPPTLMLLDLRLPGMSGLELCMVLGGMRAAEQTEVVVVSGRASREDREVLRQLGVRDFLDKRSSSKQLIGELVELLRTKGLLE